MNGARFPWFKILALFLCLFLVFWAMKSLREGGLAQTIERPETYPAKVLVDEPPPKSK